MHLLTSRAMGSRQNGIRLSYLLLGLLLVAVGFSACARMGAAPTGGPKDLAPPVLLKSLPQEGSTGFDAKTVTLDFDEYIVLQNTDKIVVSPPLSKISYQGNLKRITILIEDTLQPDQTYSINFKDAIGDLHESTPLRNYTYYFSTGEKIDSGRISGQVLDAFTLQPIKEASVSLYAQKPQEYPVVTPPDYVAVTDSVGMFHLQYIKEGCYHVFAGSDENRNYLVEPTEEKMAFSSDCWTTSLVKPPVYFEKRRGVKESDTASYERYRSEWQERKEEDLREIKANDRILYLYQDKEEKSLLKEAKWIQKGQLDFTWYYEPDSLWFVFLPSYQDVELAEQIERDTVATEDRPGRGRRRREEKLQMPNLLWPDSLTFHYVAQDDPLAGRLYFNNYNVSALRVVINHAQFSDTAELMLAVGTAAKRDTAAFKLSSRQNRLFYTDSLSLDFTFPLSAYDLSAATLTRYHEDEEGHRDTVLLDISEMTVEQVRPDRLKIKYAWQAGNAYQLFFPSSCFTDYFGRNIDTTVLRMDFPSLEKYGQLALTLKNLEPGNYQLQVVDNSGKVLYSKPVKGEGQVEFEYVQPAYVSFVLVEDVNQNRRWDSGDYKRGIQPEKRRFFPKTIRVEADWRMEETWNLQE